MLFVDPSGEEVVVPLARGEDTLDAMLLSLWRSGQTVSSIARALGRERSGVARRISAAMGRAERVLEHDVVPLDGFVGWRPDVERRTGEVCPRCGDGIKPGEPFVCLACLKSGIDDRLADELRQEAERERSRRQRK